MSLTLRRILVLVGALILALGFFGMNYLSSQKQPPPRKPVGNLIRTVDTFSVYNQDIATGLSIQGSILAYDKIDVFTEVSGTLVSSDRPFKEGSYFPKGSVLIKVDDTEARLSVQAQKSALLNAITQIMPDLKIDYPNSFQNWESYVVNFDLNKPLAAFPEPVDQQEKFFIASKNLYNQYYSIKSSEERLSKYTLRAPFSGMITLANINPGTLVRSGQKLGELMNTNNYELEASVPLSDLDFIKVGDEVSLNSTDIAGKWTGKVRRINNQLNPNTQTVTIFIDVTGGDLKEGMYLKGEIKGRPIKNAVSVPKALLVDQTALYEVVDTTLSLHPVEVLKITATSAIVRGIKDGTVLAKNKFPGMYDGMRVKVNEGIAD